jgi:hypothetical protein
LGPVSAVLSPAIAVVAAVAVTSPVAAPRLTAKALIMGGTNQVLGIPPQTPQYLAEFVNEANRAFIAPSGLCVGGDPGCGLVAVYTPQEMRFVTGVDDRTLDESVAVGRENLDACLRGNVCRATAGPFTDTKSEQLTDTHYVVQGTSQSSILATSEKRHLIDHPIPDTTVSFILVSNQNRPNGGLFERFVGSYIPLVGITFNGATPTHSDRFAPLRTIDVAHQYDGWADFPTNPLNLLADANALMGALLLHDKPLTLDSPAQLQGHYQDTTYYLKPSPVLPLLIPLASVPFAGPPAAAALDAPLRVLVEAGYDRRINPGQPTPARWNYVTNVKDVAANVLRAIPTGWDDAIAQATRDPANRPFRTAPQGVYGVGGPPVYAGAVDRYDPVPQVGKSVAAQPRSAAKPAASAPVTEDVEAEAFRPGAALSLDQPVDQPDRAARGSIPDRQRPPAAAIPRGGDHPVSSPIASGRDVAVPKVPASAATEAETETSGPAASSAADQAVGHAGRAARGSVPDRQRPQTAPEKEKDDGDSAGHSTDPGTSSSAS